MANLHIRVPIDEATLIVPASLEAITTYVLLEQEDWFEKEMSFIRRMIEPGMMAIDIGANLGLYSIAMAKRAGASGCVVAYEPTSATRAMLEQSRDLNGLDNLRIEPTAVSSRAGEGRLAFGASSELNALSETGAGETVRLTTLDAEDAKGRWPQPPDFIKIDAEGEEERIIDGATSFFSRHSPLVMFEIKAGSVINQALCARFEALGFKLYRALAGAPVLVPVVPGEPVDSYELNLFAAKADRASKLAARGLLVDAIPDWKPDDAARRRGFEALGNLTSMRGFGSMAKASAFDARFADGLAGYALWRSAGAALPIRCAGLRQAGTTLVDLCSSAPTMPRLATLARVAYDAGARSVSVSALAQIIDRIAKGDKGLSEPFWPVSQRYEAIDPGRNVAAWFLASVFEQFERTSSYSSCFAARGNDLTALAQNPFVSAEIERRRMLRLAVGGQRPDVPARLRTGAPDHVNAELWASGAVPGTTV